MWKRLATKTLLRHPRITVLSDDIELPNGSKTDYIHFGDDHDTALIIPVSDDGKILLQKEYSYPSGSMLIQFPGGAIEPKEDPLNGARRELAEEAQLTGDLQEIGWYYTNHRRSTSRQFVYIATNLTPSTELSSDPEEHFEYLWMSPSELEQLISDSKIDNITTLAAWMIYTSKFTS